MNKGFQWLEWKMYPKSEMSNMNQLYTAYDWKTLKEVQKLEGLEHKLVKHSYL